MMNFLGTNICLTFYPKISNYPKVIIQKIQSFLIRPVKKVIGKTKDESE